MSAGTGGCGLILEVPALVEVLCHNTFSSLAVFVAHRLLSLLFRNCVRQDAWLSPGKEGVPEWLPVAKTSCVVCPLVLAILHSQHERSHLWPQRTHSLKGKHSGKRMVVALSVDAGAGGPLR